MGLIHTYIWSLLNVGEIQVKELRPTVFFDCFAKSAVEDRGNGLGR
jgi:hypothetical protein